MNPKDLGTVEEMKARVRAGICRRKRMNESTCKKICQLRDVVRSCTVAVASFSQEAVTAPFDGSFDALQPFVSWLSVQPRQEVDCYELFAGKARISEAFAKGAAVCCSPVTSFSATIYKTVLCKTSGYIALGFSGWPQPCTLWCGFSKLNYPPQQLRRLRKREMDLLRFVDSAISCRMNSAVWSPWRIPGTVTCGELRSSRTTWRVAWFLLRLTSADLVWKAKMGRSCLENLSLCWQTRSTGTNTIMPSWWNGEAHSQANWRRAWRSWRTAWIQSHIL